jgi:hypothetical protein
MEMVNWLKDKYGLGHDHANAVADTLAEDKRRSGRGRT